MTRCLIWISLILLLIPSLLSAAEDGVEAVLLHPFHTSLRLQGAVTGALESGHRSSPQLDFESRADQLIRSWHLPQGIEPRRAIGRSFNLQTQNRIQTLHYRFELDGYPLCQPELKVHETLDGAMAALGGIPRMSVHRNFSEADWADKATIRQLVGETLAMKGMSTEFSIDRERRCLWYAEDELQAVYEIDLIVGAHFYSFVGDASHVYRFETKELRSSAEALIFPNNVLDSNRQTFPLTDMKTDGTLENNSVLVCLPSGSGTADCPSFTGNTSINIQQAIGANGIFSYDPVTDYSKFSQTSLFTNLNRTLEWFLDIGYKNFGTQKMRIFVHQEEQNDAHYQPRSTFPIIYVGDGDKNVLQNLTTDMDVIAHELGHHVIFHSITNLKGESLVLHEGLADFFTFARSGNACLGESICTTKSASSNVCAIPRQCLRTADNNFSLTGFDLPTEPHERSQFISGMLWDLNVEDGIPLKEVGILVLKSIDLMVSDSGYEHLVLALLLADRGNFSGKYCEQIRSRAAIRGLGAYLEDITCESVQSRAAGTKVDGSLVESMEMATSSRLNRRTKSACGVLGSGAEDAGRTSHILLMIPWMLLVLRRLRR